MNSSSGFAAAGGKKLRKPKKVKIGKPPMLPGVGPMKMQMSAKRGMPPMKPAMGPMKKGKRGY